MDLSGKAALVTGSGRGIGAVIARRLALAGAKVAVCARTSAQVEEVAESIRKAGSGSQEAIALTCDVTDRDDVDSLVQDAQTALGPIDILVNNAGGANSAPVTRITLEDWNQTIALNATSAFLLTRALLPGMLERGFGRVINVASVAGLTGSKYIAAYSAAKHALVGLTRCAAVEVAGTGVTINALCPGFVDTPMTDATLDNVMAKTGLSREKALETILALNQQPRLVTCDEVAHVALSLCDPDGAGINGQAIAIDGGGHLN